MLMGEYQSLDESPLTLEDEWAYAERTLSGNNQLVQSLKAVGYEYWHARSEVWGHADCSGRHADRCIGEGGDPEAMEALWAMTPFGQSPFEARPQDPTTVVDYVLANGADSDQPRLVFAHILSPHHP